MLVIIHVGVRQVIHHCTYVMYKSCFANQSFYLTDVHYNQYFIVNNYLKVTKLSHLS